MMNNEFYQPFFGQPLKNEADSEENNDAFMDVLQKAFVDDRDDKVMLDFLKELRKYKTVSNEMLRQGVAPEQSTSAMNFLQAIDLSEELVDKLWKFYQMNKR